MMGILQVRADKDDGDGVVFAEQKHLQTAIFFFEKLRRKEQRPL